MALFLLFTHSHYFGTVGIAFIVLSSITVMGLDSRRTGFTQHNSLPLETYDKSALSANIKQITLHKVCIKQHRTHQVSSK